jgi:hypothetical protein
MVKVMCGELGLQRAMGLERKKLHLGFCIWQDGRKDGSSNLSISCHINFFFLV